MGTIRVGRLSGDYFLFQGIRKQLAALRWQSSMPVVPHENITRPCFILLPSTVPQTYNSARTHGTAFDALPPRFVFLCSPPCCPPPLLSPGLDARAATTVMRAVRNVARNGRTVIVTIHQPSIEIFEVTAGSSSCSSLAGSSSCSSLAGSSTCSSLAGSSTCSSLAGSSSCSSLAASVSGSYLPPCWHLGGGHADCPPPPSSQAFDMLLLIQRGGRISYFGQLGSHSSALIDYLCCIPGGQDRG